MQDLKEKYARAKALGAYANSLKQKLCATKAALERRRLSQAASDIANSGPSTAAAECVDTEEAALLAQIEELKTEYQGSIDELRSLKSAIEHLQLTLQQSRTRIQVLHSSALSE
jgi:ABC-type phosphate transport system auxiliary subunit